MKNGLEALAREVIASLKERGETLATAESCTGGLIAETLTRIPGASDVFLGSVIAYADEIKTNLLGVPKRTMARHGAVSEEVAFAMARGAQKQLRATWALSVTGISGPGGGSATKPVGTTCFGLATPHSVLAKRIQMRDQGRQSNREQSARLALQMLLKELVTLSRGVLPKDD